MTARDAEPRFRSIERWLLACRHCGQRATADGPSPPREHPCPALGPDGVAAWESVQRVTYRRPRAQERGNCRQGDGAIYTIVEGTPLPGQCSRRCRGSLSPICYCPFCRGDQHGVESTFIPPAPGSAAAIMDRLVTNPSAHDHARKGRRTT